MKLKIKLFKAKQNDEEIQVTQGENKTFVILGKKVMSLPFGFEDTISYLKKIELI